MLAPSMDPDEYKKAGERIAELAGLKANKLGYYKTTWGNKTALGLAMCVERCLVEAKEPVELIGESKDDSK